MNRIMRIIKQPYRFLWFIGNHNLFPINDELYLKIAYRCQMGEKLDLKNPKTFNEKLQWLKLHDRNSIYSIMVDKYEAKKYVSNIIGEQYIIPTLGVYNSFDEINFDSLPNQFVIKCTHDSGGNFVVKDKKNVDLKEVKRKINKSLKHKYYYEGREWPYKNINPRIIIEKYMEDNSGELRDYKVYAFNGECDYLMLCFNRLKGDTKFIYFDKQWNMMKEFSNDGLKYGDTLKIDKPKNLAKMFNFASKLSKKIPFVRVDFYEVNGRLYFGELTLYPSAGFDSTRTKKCQEYLDNKLIIEKVDD